MVSEVIRVAALGWPIGYTYRAARDGRMGRYDYAEDELLIFNLPLHFDRIAPAPETTTSCVDVFTFDPYRFLHKVGGHYQLRLTPAWLQHMIREFVISVPNECICMLLVAAVLNLFADNWRVRPSEGEQPSDELDLSPVQVTDTEKLSYVLFKDNVR